MTKRTIIITGATCILLGITFMLINVSAHTPPIKEEAHPPSDTSTSQDSPSEDKPSWWTGIVRDVGPTDTSMQNSCINNLRQIEAGKEQWALEAGLSTGDPAVINEVNQYIKGEGPICPEGGVYTYNAIGTDSTCDYADASHALP